MGYLPLLIGIVVIGIWFEVFAIRRHNQLVNVLKDIEQVLESIERQTDLRAADKAQAALERFRKEFLEIADKVDERFGRMLYLDTRRFDKQCARDIRELGFDLALKRLSIESENAYLIARSSEDVKAHLKSLSKEQLKEKLGRVRSATHD